MNIKKLKKKRRDCLTIYHIFFKHNIHKSLKAMYVLEKKS